MFVDNAQQCFAFTPQAKFPAHSWIFIECEGDGIESRLPFKIFSTLKEIHAGPVVHKMCLIQYLQRHLWVFA